MSDLEDINSLLEDILNDKPIPTPAQVVVATQTNAVHGNAGQAAMDNPEDFLESLLRGDDVALTVAGEQVSHSCVTPQRPLPVAPSAPVFTDTADRDEDQQITAIKMPTFTAEDFASTMDIRNFATLVTLNTARWHAKVKDRQASKDAATANDADAGAFETRKRLLVGADSMLKAIHKAIDEARAAHYDMTLPWSTTSMSDVGRRTGGRLLPNTLFVEYTTVMAKHKQAMNAALTAFLPEYPMLIELSKKKLGKRFDAREYPNPSSISSHFDLSFDFQPIPKGDDFAGLPQAQLDALANKVNDNTRLMAENAMQDLWQRLHDSVSRMADRMGSPDKIFHDTLVQNIRDVSRLLSHLNVTGDTKVEKLRKRVEVELCGYDAKDLRKDLATRTKVGIAAKNILLEMVS